MSQNTDFFRELLQGVGAYQQGEQQRINPDSTDHKGRIDLVTEVDRESERRLVEAIRDRFPDDSILAEEETTHQGSSNRQWIIDPLDGTTNYVHGHPFYGISVGLLDGDQLTEGYTYFPELDDFYEGRNGQGAYRNGQSIHVSETSDPIHALLATGFADMRTTDQRVNLPIFRDIIQRVQGIRRAGSAVHDLCLVADGTFEGFWEFNLQSWDVAAGAVIIREAGGRVSDAAGDNDWLNGQQIVTSNGHLHEHLLSWLSDHLD